MRCIIMTLQQLSCPNIKLFFAIFKNVMVENYVDTIITHKFQASTFRINVRIKEECGVRRTCDKDIKEAKMTTITQVKLD